MKSTIQSEAEKAAKKIREALKDFHDTTGLMPKVDIVWTQANGSEGQYQTFLTGVSLEFAGVKVKA